MFLINTCTLQLHHFHEPRQPRYAILSHTWGDDEVSYSDFSNLEAARSKSSYSKIVKTCQLAESRGLEYVWIDTCCIDKSSSAELTEAINSMFRWYREAEVCFAYISDLPPHNGGPVSNWLDNGHYRWFTRGWTLQELVAPDKVEFYDAGWEYRGDKAALIHQLHRVTGIDKEVLADSRILPEVPVARKMSWAANRKTTRTEDMAYCLLGLFDINLPMIYGEGERAFLRLQEEIARETNDMSLFAWRAGEDESDDFRGIFAKSPAEFAGCRDLVRLVDILGTSPEFFITNHGVRMETALTPAPLDPFDSILDLGCCDTTADGVRLGIWVHRVGSRFIRRRPNVLQEVDLDQSIAQGFKKSTIYMQKHLSREENHEIYLERRGRMYLQFSADCERSNLIVRFGNLYPEGLWDPNGRYFLTMQSVTWRSAAVGTVYPRFIGCREFEIQERGGRHLCKCLLVCGIFKDHDGSEGPCAVVYQDTDPKAKAINKAIARQNGEANAALLDSIRGLVTCKHSSSPSNGTLSWKDVSDREVQVILGRRVLRIRLEITVKGGIVILGGQKRSSIRSSEFTKQAFAGSMQYVVSVCIGHPRSDAPRS